ncbi:MAG: hypothetical protein ACRYG2_29730 [Janthinobacterium lividum]
MIELVVGMSLLSIFMAMFTGAVVMMNKAENKTEAVSLSATQLNQAFLTLDKTIRYASAISTPGLGTSTKDWYTELQSKYTSIETCTQLRVDITAQQVQQRTWTPSATTSDLTAWKPIASGITNGSAASGATTQPFYLRPVVGSARFQQLTINIVSPASAGSTTTTSTSAFTFAAINSSVPVTTTSFCQQQGRP